ncbi:uncharacterized protein LOC143958051 isoform X3 [Lithobates pipiens]
MYNLKAFVVRRALGGGRRENEGEKKWKEAVEREEQHLRSQRRKIWLQVFNTKETAERRELKHQVVAHKIVNKVPSPCPEEMRQRIPSRAAERAEAEAQTKPCEAIVEQSIVPSVERTTIQEKKMESIKTVPEMSPLEKLKKEEKLKQTKTCKKGLEQGLRRKMLVRHVFYTDQPVKRKATDVNELTPVIRKTKQLLKVFGPNDPEEEKQEEMCQKKATELQELDLAIQRTQHFLTLFNITNREKRREIKHQVVAHRIINKVPSPYPEEMRHRIPSRATGPEEAEAQLKRYENVLEWSNAPREEKKEVQKESLFRRFLKSFRVVKTSSSSETTKISVVDTNQETKPCEAIVEQSIVPRVERTTIQEKKMESIQSVPEMSPLETQKEEKRKQTRICKKGLEQGLRRKMLVRHVFYTDQPVKRKATDVNELTPVIRKTKQLLKVFGPNDPEEEKQEEMCQKKATELQELDLAIHRTKHFLTLFKFTSREKRREIKHQVVAHKIVNKVPSPCPEEMRHRIPSRAAERAEAEAQTKPCEAIVEQSIVPRVERTTIQEKKMESIKTVPEMSPLEKLKKEEKLKQTKTCKKGLEQGLRRKMLVRHVFYTDQPVKRKATDVNELTPVIRKTKQLLKVFGPNDPEEEKQEEMCQKKATELQELDLAIQRTKHFLTLFNFTNREKRREIKHQVVAHKIINKVPSPCPEEMRHRIPSRAAERAEAEAQTKPCEAIVEQSIVPRVERTTIQEKKMESIKSVPEMSPLEKLKKEEKLKQTKICKKGLEQGLRRKMLVRHVFYKDQPVKRKATDVNELTPVIRKTKQLLKVFGTNDPEEEKQEEMCQKKATELQELDLAIQRTKHFLTLFNFTNREKRREIKHQVVAHKIINKVPSPCPEEMRHRIPSRAAERAEAEAQTKPCEAIVEQSIVPREERTTIQEKKMESIKTVPEMSPLEKLKKEEKLKQTRICKKGLEQGLRRKMLVRHVFYTDQPVKRKATDVNELTPVIRKTKQLLKVFGPNDPEEEKQEEMCQKKAIELQELDLAIQRTQHFLTLFNITNREKRREIKHQVVAHRIINKVPSPCPEEMRHRIPSRAAERAEAEAQTKPCEAIVEQSIVPRVERTIIQEKKMESIKTVPEMSPLEKLKKEEKLKQTKICKKGLEQGLRRKMLVRHVFYTDQPVKRKATDVNELTPVIRKTKQLLKVFGTNDPEEEKQEEMCQKKATELQEVDLAIHRTKHFLTLFKFTNREKRREIKHQVVAHRIINKVPSPCPEEMRQRIPARAMEQEEEKIHRFKNIFEWSNHFSEQEKEVQSENLFSDKTSGRKNITKTLCLELKEAAKQKKTWEKGEREREGEMEGKKMGMGEQMEKKTWEKGKREGEMEEKKMGVGEQMEKEKTNTFTEEEKRKVEEEVEWKKKNERKVKAMRDRIQRVKLYEKMTDTEDPEEKRKLMQRVIAHKMINKIGAPCTGQRRNSILVIAEEQEEGIQNKNLSNIKPSVREKITETLCLELKGAARQKKTWEKGKREREGEMEEKKMGVGEQMEEKTNTFTEEEKRKVEEEVEWKKKNERKVKAMRDRIQRVKLYEKMTDTEDPEEKRKLMQRVIAHKMINKIGAPCTGQRRNSILVIAEEEEKEIQNKNLSNIKPSVREKITEIPSRM